MDDINNSSDIPLTQAFAKQFQSNKKMMQKVSMSHQGQIPGQMISNNINEINSKSNQTINSQSFLSQQSKVSYSRSNRDKIIEDTKHPMNIHNSSIMIVDPLKVNNENAGDVAFVRNQ